MAPHERWTFADYADLAVSSGAPSLARFFTNCRRGAIPRRIPTDVSPATVAALVSALAEHRQVEISDVREEDADELFADDDPYPTPWQYYGPYGGHPALPTALHGVCLAACDECAPDQVWQVRPARRREEAAIWYVADAQDEIFDNACNGYPMLPSRSILVARHTAPFLSEDWTDTPFWAVGVAYREVLLGLTALVSPSRAGTMIVRYWQAQHPWLIGHNVCDGTESYWQKQGFVTVPCPLPIPLHCCPLTVMAWQATPEIVIERMEELALPWWMPLGETEEEDMSETGLEAIIQGLPTWRCGRFHG